MSGIGPGRADGVGALAPGSGLHVVGAPAIPSLRFRTWLGNADLPALARVRNEAWAADSFDEWVTPDVLGSELATMSGLEPAHDLVVVECDDRGQSRRSSMKRTTPATIGPVGGATRWRFAGRGGGGVSPVR